MKFINYRQRRLDNRQEKFKDLLVCLLFGCVGLVSCQTDEEIKYDQYYIAGKKIYEENCANCHQKNGEGLRNLYPPITNSTFFKDKNKLFCIIKNGLSGEIMVKGKTYNQPMPANPLLQNLDIAELSTYILREFNNEEKLIKTEEVNEALKVCK